MEKIDCPSNLPLPLDSYFVVAMPYFLVQDTPQEKGRYDLRFKNTGI